MDQRSEARKQIDEIDARMAELFERRMRAAAVIAAYKREHGLPILDEERERAVIETNSLRIADPEIRSCYTPFLEKLLELSRRYQHRLLEGASAPTERKEAEE